MKQDGKINHDKHGFDAFGITDERFKQINKFIDKLACDGYEKNLKRSQVVERIIDFAESMTEAVVIYGYVESQLASKRKNPLKGIIEIQVGDHEGNDVPDGVKKALLEVIRDIHEAIQAEQVTGLKVDKDGNLN